MHSKLLGYARISSASAVVVGTFALLDRIYRPPLFASWHAALGSMKANSALAFILSGMALWLLSNAEDPVLSPELRGKSKASPSTLKRRVAQICGTVVALAGALTLAEYVFGWDLGIDQALLRQDVGSRTLSPERMAPTSALNFVLLGLALLLFNRHTSWGHRWSEYLSLPLLLIGGTALAGYLYDEQSLYKVGPYASMALHSAALFVIVGIGIFCARPATGLMKILASDEIGGLVARKVLPIAVGLPLVAGGLQIAGERRNWFGFNFGVALLVTLGAASAIALMWWLAGSLNRLDARRRHVEQDLRRSEEHARLILGSAGEGIYGLDLQGKTTFINAAAARMLGYSPEELIGKSMHAVLHHSFPDGLPYRAEHCPINRTLKDGQSHSIDTEVFWRKDGTSFPVHYTSTPTRHEKKISGAVIVFGDITERQRNREALREQEEWLRLAMAAGKIGTFEWNVQMGRFRLSPELEAIYGLEPGAFDGAHDSWIKRIHHGDWEQVGKSLDDVFGRRGTDFTIEFRINRPNGDLRWVEARCRVAYDDIGRPLRVIGANLDITDRRQADAAVREREERYRRLVQLSPDAILINRDNRIVFINEQGMKLLGATHRDEILGKSPFDLFHPDYHRVIEQRLRTMLESGEDVPPLEEKVVRLDGTTVDVEVVAGLVTDQDATTIQVVLRDITERKRADEALRESEARFRSTFECNIVPMGVWSLEKGITAANDALLNLLGYSREDLLSGKISWPEITPPEQRYLDEQAMKETIGTGVCTPFEKECFRKDGSRVPVLVGGAMFTTRRDAGVFFILNLSEQKKAEAEIRRSEERFRLMVEEVQDYAIFLLDPQGRVATWNAGAERANGYRADEIIGRHFSCFYIPEDIAAGVPAQHVELAEAQGKVVDEGWRVRKDGSRFWADVVITAVHNEQGMLLGFSKVTRDLTEQKQAEAALEDARHRLQVALSAAEMGTWTWDIGSAHLMWDETAARLFGKTMEEVEDGRFETFMASLHEEDRARVAAALGRSVEETTPYEVEFRIVRSDGAIRWMTAKGKLVSDLNGRPQRMTGAYVDITERKKAEEGLRHAEERFRTAAESASDLIYEWEIRGGRLQWFGDVDGALGYPRGEFPRTFEAWGKAIHPDDLADVMAGVERRQRSADPFVLEYRVIRKDGSVRYWTDRGQTLRDETGRAMRVVGVTTDITDRKNAEEEIRRLLAEAEQRERELRAKQAQLVQSAKLASIGELATGLAHELNNPFNNIGLFIGNAIDFLKLDKSKEDILTDLRGALEQVHRGASIINHLRAFGRTASPHMQPVSIDDVIRNGLSLMQEQLRLRNIEVVTDLSAYDAEVLGNATQLEQVIVNLLGNARDAVADSSQKVITVRSGVQSNLVEITVQDSGTGIPSDAQAKIFDPFFTTKPVGEGTGLGLSITYGIISEHKGAITVEGRPGEGAAFIIQLPLARTAESGGESPA